MPRVDTINGITIHLYNGDHRPPHIHARYNEFEILIVIKTGHYYAGNMPKGQLKKVFLLVNWQFRLGFRSIL